MDPCDGTLEPMKKTLSALFLASIALVCASTAAAQAGPGTEPALRGPTRNPKPPSTQAIEPPPAPIVTMSSVGASNGYGPIRLRLVSSGAPLEISDTSALVPPMSRVIRFWIPQLAASALAPMMPPITPECVMAVGARVAESNVEMPPLPRMMKGLAGTPCPASASCRPRRWRVMGPRMKALTHVVLVRSNSRNSRTTSEESETSTCGQTSAASSAMRRSCAGFAYACSRQTAMLCTPAAASSRNAWRAASSSSGVTTCPRWSTRSGTPQRRCLATKGRAGRQWMS